MKCDAGIEHEKLAKEFDDFVFASVAIKSSPERLYAYLTDIVNLSEFFPQIEFKLDTENPLEVGSVYYTRKKGARDWTTYRVVTLEPNSVMSAELYGKDPFFAALKYKHMFLIEGNKTVSYEKVEYRFRFGLLGRLFNFLIGKKLVRNQVLDAHLKLKKEAEKFRTI